MVERHLFCSTGLAVGYSDFEKNLLGFRQFWIGKIFLRIF
jgi:hypothetical protein